MCKYAMLAILAFPSATAANPLQFEDLDALERRAAAVAGAPVQALDRRIKLVRCPNEAAIEPAEYGALAARCPALGWRMRIAISNSVASAATRAATKIIKRGDGVELTVIGDGFELKSQAIALDDAAEGQSLRVKPLSSSSLNQAIAVAPGKVLISP